MTVYIDDKPYVITPTSRIEMTGAEYIIEQSNKDKLMQNLEDAYELNKQIPKLEEHIEALRYQLKKERCMVSALLQRDAQHREMTQKTETYRQQASISDERSQSLKEENNELRASLRDAYNLLKKVVTYA